KFCFACGQENPIGLKLRPVHDGDEVTADFTPGQFHQGWDDATHGGILYTLLDELAFYAILCKGVDFAVTGRSDVKFRKVAPVNEPLRASARVIKLTRRLVEARALLTLRDGTVIAEGDFLYYVLKLSRRAVLWDMDGVIADTAALHLAAWQETFARRGIRFTDEDFAGLFGARNDLIIRTVMDDELSPEDVRAIARDKEETFRTRATGKISPFPGAVRLLDAVRKGGFRQGLISSAPRENIEMVLGELGLEGLFDCILCGKEVTESKPSPQICLTAAERLGLTPEDCLVIEDSPLGVKAAKTAGMRCLAVASTRPRQELGEADRVVDSLEDVDLITLLIRV
ncbi:MAG: HAD-IA family hydrolase, partial [Dehalococcoidia bacterium]